MHVSVCSKNERSKEGTEGVKRQSDREIVKRNEVKTIRSDGVDNGGDSVYR